MQITVGQFLNYVKATSLQNISQDFSEDDTWLFFINQANIFMYNYIASYGSWYWSNKDEELTPIDVEGTQFNTQYGIGRVFSLQGALGGELHPANISLDMAYEKTEDEPSAGYRRGSSAKSIITASIDSGVKITYSRMPEWHTIDGKTDQFDCPAECFIGVLLLTNWLMFPIHLEQGASLANNYYSQAITFLDTYAKNLNPTNTRFSA